MFEEEAKKHKEEFITIYISVGGGLKAADMIGIQKEQSYQEGAEFGYNKANEWHKVSDGVIPKENKMCLLYLGNRFNPITGWIENGIWHFEDDRKSSVWQTKVIAWKEIIPPKEIEEND